MTAPITNLTPADLLATITATLAADEAAREARGERVVDEACDEPDERVVTAVDEDWFADGEERRTERAMWGGWA